MMDSLRSCLLSSDDDPLTAERWNSLVEGAIRRGVRLGDIPPTRGTFAHPYQVTVALDPAATNTAARNWRVRTQLGSVNDTPAAFVYRATDDPRGWQPPATIDPAKTPLVDRTMLETDDPPFLLLTTPAVGQAVPKTDHFQPVTDAARPAFFRTLERWEKDLYQSHVLVTSEAKAVVSPSLPAVLLSRLPQRYRIIGGVLPPTPNPSAGGQLEIATLYLLRDPAATDASGDTITVRQRVFWNLAALYVQPANPLDGYGDAGVDGGIIADLFASAATFQWWTM